MVPIPCTEDCTWWFEYHQDLLFALRIWDFGGGPRFARKARTGIRPAEKVLFAHRRSPKQEDPTFFIGRRGCLLLLKLIGGRAEGAAGNLLKFEVGNCQLLTFDFDFAAVLKFLQQLHYLALFGAAAVKPSRNHRGKQTSSKKSCKHCWEFAPDTFLLQVGCFALLSGLPFWVPQHIWTRHPSHILVQLCGLCGLCGFSEGNFHRDFQNNLKNAFQKYLSNFGFHSFGH